MTTKDNFRQTRALIVLGFFAATVVLLGGSSRADAIQIAALRPLVGLFLIPAIYLVNIDDIRTAKPLVLLLTFLALWMALQLVPLPPGFWQALPRREAIAELDSAVGQIDLWRPISWVPSRGWNTLASLIVPVVALVLPLSLSLKPRTLLILIAGVGVVDALLALFQVASGRASALYFYEITNRNSPVGVFANENHSAVLSAIVLLVLARLGGSASRSKDPPWLRFAYPPLFVVVLLAAFVSGSRAGLAMTALALLASGAIAWSSLAQKRRGNRRGALQRWLASHPRAILALFVAAVLALFAAFSGLERAPAFADILNQNAFEDLRWRLWPLLTQMMGEYWIFGIGFGSFDEVYHLYEPTELLFPQYVNQAHNDWAQFVIEGGLPAIALLAGLLGWVARTLLVLTARYRLSLVDLLFWAVTVAILCAASIVDYPLRTPIFMLVGTWLLLTLALEKHELVRRFEAR